MDFVELPHHPFVKPIMSFTLGRRNLIQIMVCQESVGGRAYAGNSDSGTLLLKSCIRH